MKNSGRDPNVILELWVLFTESIEKTVELEREWIKESVEHAKQLLDTL